jgi:uncharacterized membrane protein YkvA (DUF1232 family)
MGDILEGEILGPGVPVKVEDVTRNEQRVRAGFWKKLKRVVARIPFADDLLAAYYCALDPATPFKVRAVLFASLAYFVMPADLVPDVLLHLGFTDDATVLATALSLVAGHIKPRHRKQAAAVLDLNESDAI